MPTDRNPDKSPDLGEGMPDDMSTPMYSVQDLALLIAKDKGLEPGKYEVVVQFKLSPIQMKDEQSSGPVVPAMGVGFGSFGLRPATTGSSLSIEVPPRAKAKSK